jgi:predicted dehydrogenase
MPLASQARRKSPYFATPEAVRPITIIGAGGIVRDAHLPAYRLAGFPVHGICDLEPARAKNLADEYGIGRVYSSAAEALRHAPEDGVFDLATPPDAILTILNGMPEGAAVLMQKPMGRDIGEAREIRQVCRAKKLTAAVNFQLRFAPAMIEARRLIEHGAIGEVNEMDVRVAVHTPWELWGFLEALPRMEIPMHSIHYLDLIRSFLGEPRAVWAHTSKHPASPRLASSRSHVILDYGDWLRAAVSTNHGYRYGPQYQEAHVKWEGSEGAIRARLGLLMDYPKGAPDSFEYCKLETGRPAEWRSAQIEGSWFPHAFMGTMGSLMRYLEGSCAELPTSFEDAYRTMELAEAAYLSSDSGGTPVGHD